MFSLANNISGIQVFVGSFNELYEQIHLQAIHYKEHPLNLQYSGTEDSRDWISEDVTDYYPSFFAYWKKIEKQLLLKYS